jgi:amino acid adenylation domain-containing protein
MIIDTSKQLLQLPLEERRAILDILKERGSEFNSFPLSSGQRRHWFLDQFEPGSPRYNASAAFRVGGDLDTSCLRRSLQEVVRRHEILRTTFLGLAGQPIQVVHDDLEIALPVVDLTHVAEGEREGAAREIIMRESQRPFDLSTLPLLRITLLMLAGREHVLLVVMHHIISDGWSVGVLMREVTALYEAYLSGKPSPLDELDIQYADYAAWQQEWLEGEELAKQISYWRGQLGGELPILELPTDRPRPAHLSHRGAREWFDFGAGLLAQLKELGHGEGATLFMVMLTAFNALLHRYTGQREVIVGTPIANRNRTEVEPLIGLFVNTLALRSAVSGDQTPRDLLRESRRITLEAYAHQDVPFERLVEELQPDRSLSHTPLFQVMLALQNSPMPEMKMGGLSFSPVEIDSGLARFDLLLFVEESERGLKGSIEYSTDLFNRATIRRMIGHLRALLEAIAADADVPLWRLPILTDPERKQLSEWNRTAADYPINACIHQLFEAQADSTPEAAAIVLRQEEISYRELDRRANRLAHYLQSLGVRPESLVAICTERSIAMVVGLLGILKAGGAYVPLDPAYPKDRLAFMLEDGRVPVLLTEHHLLDSLSEHSARAVCLDADWPEIERQSEARPATRVRSNNLAYVIYTSGSTGRPKGVAIEHRSAVAMVDWARSVYTPEETAGVLASTSICFDLSVYELFVPLSRGGKVLLAENALQLPSLPHVADVTLINTVPSAMGELVRMKAMPRSVTTVNLAGEPLTSALARQVLLETDAGVKKLYNLYGPSEDTTYSTFALVDADKNPTIGRPISNTEIFILDAHMQVVPAGVPGELYISGEGLARGYLNRPKLTAEKFIPNPFSDKPGRRLYRTGDLARYLDDGNIDFLGRIDHQVKVRGFRIELGEIQSALLQHPAVKDAAVTVRGEGADKKIVAYVVGEAETVSSAHELRSFLASKLPDFMIPAAVVELGEMPLTPNGKLDRSRLPDPSLASPQHRQQFTPPRNPTEDLLSSMWMSLLSLPTLSVHDSFFDLGGHSLLATQLISRVRDAFGIEVPLRSLFEHPSVASFARALESARHAHASAAVAGPIERADRRGPLPLSFAQQRLWFLDRLDPMSPLYNISGALELSGRLSLVALEQALRQVVSRHEALRTSFRSEGGSPAQLIARRAELDVSLVDLTSLGEGEQERELMRLAREEARRPFELGRCPLMRASVVRLTRERHVLLVSMHHIISDGWSIGLLIKEVSSLYNSGLAGRPAGLAELSVQYADYSVWHRGWLERGAMREQLAYWRGQLGGAARLELPTDRPRGASHTGRGAKQEVTISAELTRELKRLSRETDATLYMVLLAAFKVLLMRYSGQRDVVVGTPIANRGREEAERLIGLFVNTVAIRTSLEGGPSFREVVGRVRESALGAYANQEVPFEKVVEELQPDRSLTRQPVFDVMFVLQNTPGEEAELEGLEVRQVRVDSLVSKFELTLQLEESGGGLVGWVEYDSELYEGWRVERMVRHLEVVLREAVGRPEEAVTVMRLMGEEEEREVVGLLRGEERELGWESIQEEFERVAESRPEAVALESEAGVMTYGELNRRANRLSRRLMGMGVSREGAVGVYLERGGEMVVGLLGVLKAGAAYVALDAAYPKDRIAFMIQDARPNILLTQQRLLANLPDHNMKILCLDRDWDDIAQESDEAVASNVTGENLACIIYTSGSTGKPKGVLITHKSIRNYLSCIQEAFPLTEKDTVPQKYSLSFDVAALEIFYPLISGARLFLARPQGQQDVDYMLDLIVGQKVAAMDLVPSMLQALIADERFASCDSLRHVFCGGESMTVELQERFFKRSNAQLHNFYGPTETTIGSTYWTCKRGDNRQTIPIGRPIANTHVYLLDRHGQLVPPGVTGEICIGGVGVTRGYLNHPGLTAEKFVPDPFSDKPGERVYKTGDLARYLPDGNIEFVGRADHQVKVRGFRVEMGEIEAALNSHHQIRESAVIAHQDDQAGLRLVAYVVPAEGGSCEINDVRDYLKKRLPHYMIPAAVVELGEMPLTPNGKLDRSRLPDPSLASPQHRQQFTPPRNPTEDLLSSMWMSLLSLPTLSVHDSFFDLGGHSLLATQLISRVRDAFGIEVPLRSLFEHPSVASFARALESARHAHASAAVAGPIERADRRGPLPLSFAQQRLWFLDRLDPMSPLYNISGALELSGRLSLVALEQALRQVVSRHEALRTSFRSEGGSPAQLIARRAELDVSLVDLTSLGEGEQERELMRLAREEARRPFELGRCPLMRASVVRLTRERHVLLVSMHHIISDGWSIGLLIKEVSSLYNSGLAGRPAGLAELSVQYADYSVWHRGWLERGAMREQLAYWRGQLGGAARLELPTDRPRGASHTGRGAKQEVTISAELTRELKRLSRETDATLYMVLLAAFKVLLMRYSGQRDVVVGTPIANRGREEAERLIGLFVNTVAIRTSLEGGPSFREVVGRVRESALGAYANQEVPFEKVVEELQPDRSLTRQPVFDVMFVLQNTPGEEAELEGLEVRQVRVDSLVSKFELTLQLEESGGGLVGWVEYDSELYEGWRVERMVRHLEVVLREAVGRPEEAVTVMRLMGEEEEREVVGLLRGEERELGWESIQEEFERVAESRPEAVALESEAGVMTYGELNRRANRLSRRLMGMGVSREGAVGVYLERGGEMVVGLLGVLKAGAAYVALDAAYPKDRIAFMLKQSRVRILLTQHHLVERLPEHTCEVIRLDTDWPDISKESVTSLSVKVRPDNVAYIIYTSGSTGEPKGVLGLHGGALNRFAWMWDAYPFEEGEVCCQKTSLGFVDSIWEIFGPLLKGIRTVIIPDDVVKDPLRLIDELARKEVTRIVLVPSLLQAILDSRADLRSRLPRLKVVVTSGEALPVKLLDRFREAMPGVTLLNLYGSSEVAGDVTWHDTTVDGVKSCVPIGRPLHNTQVYLLDRHLQLVPAGVPGEVYVGGANLARGYAHRPEQTAERFIPDPFACEPGGRLYRTGDLARLLPDGNTEYLGRVDHQVKIRGFRIEAEEIEAVLSRHAGVRKAVVVAHGDCGDKRLICYVVADQPAPAADELRRFVGDKLPDYMVPSAFVFLDALPLLPNGKVHLSALPAPDATRPELTAAYVPPQSEAEQIVAGIWQEALKVEKVGIQDNFFDLGGHSLLLVRVQARLQEALGRDVALMDLFKHPTVSSLARYLDRGQSDQASIKQIRDRVSKQREAMKRLQQLARERMMGQ